MSRRLPVICAALTAAAVIAPAAGAQAPQPAPQPAAGKAAIAVSGGLATKKIRYFSRNQVVAVEGSVRPYVPGQVMRVHVLRGKRTLARLSAAVRPGRRGNGVFSARFKTPESAGFLRIVAKHEATAEQAAFRAPARRIQVVRWQAGSGSHGTKVLLLQRTLRSLGFATPVSGHYDGGTARAVLAFRKTNSMSRTGFADVAVYAKVLRRQGAFRLRYPRAGRHVEFDWSRQVLVLARGGKPWRVYHSSSGAPATPTVFGSFRFYRKSPGTNAKGMVHSSYFIRGYAIHGYMSVPNYPASHGCLRVPIPNARDIFNNVALGERIFVYR
jgi:hypothetical protein